MYIMKNFKDIRNILNEFVETPRDIPGGGGGGDDDHSMMLKLLDKMHNNSFEYETSDGHTVKFNSKRDALIHIGRLIALHTKAEEFRLNTNPKSHMVQYHLDAGDKISEIHEALRKSVKNNNKISPELRKYADKLFNINIVSSEVNAARDGRRLEKWSKSHEQHQEPHIDLQHIFNADPDKGYFVHKDEME